jgi:uncharacterized repeat protein (TIGR01451 family)
MSHTNIKFAQAYINAIFSKPMKKQQFSVVTLRLVIAALALLSGYATAQPTVARAQALSESPAASPVSAKLVQKLIATQPDGQESLTEVTQVKPGDKLQYELTYSNSGSSLIKGLMATLPIPTGTSYLPDSAMPPPTTVSEDGEQFGVPPLKRKVERKGKLVDEVVPPQAYKALRWSIGELAAKGAVTVKARVEVNSAR